MVRYIDAVTAAEIISEKMGIHIGDLVDVFAEIPTADVVPKSEVVEEFTNRLKERLYTIPTVYNSHFGRMVDDIAKDMKGE